MSSYQLTEEAEEDLREIARYTIKTWGKKQLATYRKALNKSFKAIAKGDVIARAFSEEVSGVFVIKSGAHYIFYLTPENQPPIIIAVLHEARDLVQHLASRLDTKN